MVVSSASSPRAGFRPAGFGRLGAFFTNTTPEGAPKLGPESRGCNAWSAVAGGVAARDPEQSPAMMTLPMDAGAEKCPATLRNPACVRPVHGMANKVEVLGLAARRRGLSTVHSNSPRASMRCSRNTSSATLRRAHS